MEWYPRYPAHYDRDTLGLNLAEHGAYCRLLDYYYTSEENLPGDDRSIAGILRCGLDEWLAVKDAVLGYFNAENGRLINAKCEAILADQRERKGSKAENARINGKKGGRPKGAKTKTKRGAKPRANPELTQEEPRANPEVTQRKPTYIHTDSRDISGNGRTTIPTTGIIESDTTTAPQDNSNRDSGFSGPPAQLPTGKVPAKNGSEKWDDGQSRLEFAQQKMAPEIARIAGIPIGETYAVIFAAEDPEDPDHAKAVTVCLQAAKDAGVGWVSPERRGKP